MQADENVGIESTARGVLPPPLPRRSSAWRFVFLFAGGVVAMAAIAATAWFLYAKLGTQEIELKEEQRAALHRAADLQEWHEFEVDEGCETWTGERLFDGAVELSYEYDDPRDEAPYLNASLHYEPRISDARTNFMVLWHGAKLGLKLSDTGAGLEERNDLFRWGDASRMGFLTHDGGRYGIIFCARKGHRVYLLMTSGAVIEEKAEIDAFLRPKLVAAAAVEIDGARH